MYARLVETDTIRERDREVEIGGLEFYLEAFYELSSCRVSGMSLGPIPFTAIHEYSRLYDVDDFDEFLYVIRRMDNALLKCSDEKSKKTRENGGPSGEQRQGDQGRRQS